MNRPTDPANFFAYELQKIVKAINEPNTVPYRNETNEQFHERMAALSRAAFRVPEGTNDNSTDYDGDGGRNWRDERDGF